MTRSELEFQMLILKAINNKINHKEYDDLEKILTARLAKRKELRRSYKEKIILSAISLYDNDRELRNKYIIRMLERWRQQILEKFPIP